MTTEFSPNALAETVEVAREYLHGDPACRAIDCLAKDFAKALVEAHERLEGKVRLAQGLVEAHDKIDQLYIQLEGKADGKADGVLRAAVGQVLRETDGLPPSAVAYRELQMALRTVLDRDAAHAPSKEAVSSRDTQRLDWLAADPARLLQVRLAMIIEGISLHEAIDNSEAMYKKLNTEA